MRPRCLVGENSETSVEATGSSAPRPRPITKRAAKSASNVHENAMAPLASPNTIIVAVNTVLRPSLSARKPPSAAPMAMPMKPIDSTHDFCVASRLKCGSAAIAVTTNETRPTSIASNAQPTPEATSRRRCALLKGRRSRRSLRVSGAPSRSQVSGSTRGDGAPATVPAGISAVVIITSKGKRRVNVSREAERWSVS